MHPNNQFFLVILTNLFLQCGAHCAQDVCLFEVVVELLAENLASATVFLDFAGFSRSPHRAINCLALNVYPKY